MFYFVGSEEKNALVLVSAIKKKQINREDIKEEYPKYLEKGNQARNWIKPTYNNRIENKKLILGLSGGGKQLSKYWQCYRIFDNHNPEFILLTEKNQAILSQQYLSVCAPWNILCDGSTVK